MFLLYNSLCTFWFGFYFTITSGCSKRISCLRLSIMCELCSVCVCVVGVPFYRCVTSVCVYVCYVNVINKFYYSYYICMWACRQGPHAYHNITVLTLCSVCSECLPLRYIGSFLTSLLALCSLVLHWFSRS